ncbi:MAG: M20/M25/M40 family metallo-hydrolase [Bacteroidetes bacterium]|nr:M20/M25/M40 family metallo-hydrolase [Bacteroidota bacterium]
MKPFVFIFLGLIVCTSAVAQKVNKIIRQKDVTRIIQTLAADDMKGRSAMDPESIGKAAAFIEKEFKNIGLSPLPGASGYLQEFSTHEKIEPTRISVQVNGKPVPAENTILYSDALSINLKPGALTDYISKEKSFRASLRPYLRDTVSKIVFVAPEHEKEFREIYGYFGGPRLVQKSNTKKGTVVFILSNPATDFSVEANQKKSSFRMTNVVGMLEGKTKKEEMVVFSGHYDHIGIRAAVEGDSIANGADDDASGTTAVIALARYFKKIKNNNRTLVFVAFTAEEIGGFGSQYFSKQLPPEKVVAMFNIEMIGKPSKWGQSSAFITGFEKSDFGTILQKNLTGTPFQFQPDPYPQQNLFYRSDNATLARLGVPAHTISTDQIDIDKLYHSVNDEVESLDMANITATIRAIALSARSIISADDTPKRIAKDQVK